MRRREAEWFFARGGLALCFAHPDVAHPDVSAECDWRRYSWLPVPPSFSYQHHLHAGFGTPGLDLTDDTHQFAPFIREFASRLAYRATIDETAPGFADYGRVFARNRAGAAVAVELTAERGRIILVPPLLDPRSDRNAVAQSIFACFEAVSQPPG
jgi:hypothetical protein